MAGDGSGTSVDSTFLDPGPRVSGMPNVDPIGVEVQRITIPEHADPDGPRTGYTIDCPDCGQWNILGLRGRVSEDDGTISMDGAWACNSSSCDFVGLIDDGRIEAKAGSTVGNDE